jgi:hypothetical protein
MNTYSFSEKMDEKASETLLPSAKGHMVTIPNDVQQLTIKDSTVFIGTGHSRRSMSSCFRCLIVLSVFLAVGMGVIILQPTLYHLIKVASISQTANNDFYPSFYRNTPDSLVAPIDSAKRTVSSTANEFSQNEFDLTGKQSGATILYSMRNPSASLSDFYQFISVYIARDYQTTLSFFFQSSFYSTYLDDVSVNRSSYGAYPLIVNGNFENGTYGWDGVYSVERCYSSYSSIISYCHRSSSTVGSALSQTFSTTPGTKLYISFKLRWDASGSGTAIKVTIYP